MEISKSAVLLANEHESDQKNVANDFSSKSDSVSGMPENVASRRSLTKMAASVFHRILSNIKTNSRYKSPIYGYLPHEEKD